MANIIDVSFFIGDIEIPNSNQPEIKVDVENSIVLYEREVLVALLGWSLYKELRDATIIQGDKFDKLINGEDFTYDDNGVSVDLHWDGLKGANKKSLIAYYVYFKHRRKRQSYTAGVQKEVTPNTENSTGEILQDRLIYVWNEFVFLYGDGDFNHSYYNYPIASPLNRRSRDYNYYNHPYGYSMYYGSSLSAYDYLNLKFVDFPNWIFTSQEGEINSMGI